MIDQNNELSHFGTIGMRWGTRSGQKKITSLGKQIDKSMRKFDSGCKGVNIDTFREYSRLTRKLTFKANKRIARMNKYLNRTKGESVNNMLVKFKKDPEKVKKVKAYLSRNEIQTKKLSEIRSSLMDIKLDMM